jgi:hypothetical protein avisC_03251
MPKEARHHPHHKDTETPTDGVETPATDDTAAPEPAKNQRRYAFLSRHISTLRDLRLSGILTIFSSIAVFAFLGGSTNSFGPPKGLLLGLFLGILPILIIWGWGSQKNAWRRSIALLFALVSVTAAGFLINWWWRLYDQTSFKSAFLLAPGLASVGLGLLIATDLLLRGVRDHAGIAPGDDDDPSILTPYRPSADSAATGRGKRILRGLLQFIRVLMPTAVLVAAVVVAHTVANPVTQMTAPLPEGPLPERPAGIGTALAWTKEVPGLLGTASGAAGPVILTTEGVTGLNPADGGTLWSYTRKNTRFCMGRCKESSPLRAQYPYTSPTGRYIAVQFGIPEDLLESSKEGSKPIHDAMTVVLDTLTGQVTGEHPSNEKNKLQLTDSALLDGDTAYNLDNGKIRWKLAGKKERTYEVRASERNARSGPAGHRSFILTGPDNKYNLISDTDPTSTTGVANLADDPLTERLVVVNGWTIQYRNSPDSENGEPRKNLWGREARAVTLDSLAGLDDGTTPVDLGRISGVNSAASRASGTLATYPPYDGRSKFDFSEYTDDIWVGTVFDPVTQRVIPATQDAGLAAAKVGIVATSEKGQLSGSLVVRPGDGSDGATIPIVPGSTVTPPEQLARDRRLKPMQFFPIGRTRYAGSHILEKTVDAMKAPGVTLLLLDGGGKTMPLSQRYYYDNHVYRSYGLTGAIS